MKRSRHPHRGDHRLFAGRRLAAGALVLALLAPPVALAEVKIDHDPVKKSKSGERIEIEAKIRDKKAPIRDARAYFKSGYDSRFWFAPMRWQGNRYVGILPAPALGASTVQYRIYAVNGAEEFVKSDLFTIRIKDDEDALARLEAKEPTNVEIDLDEIEQMRDLARDGGEPDPSRKVEVRNDVPTSELPTTLPGFQDYIVLANAAPAAAGAGLAAATSVGVGGGVGAGAVLGGAAALGGVAAATGGGGGDDDDSGSVAFDSGADRTVQCNNLTEEGGNTPEIIDVELGQRSGTFDFEYETFSEEDRMLVRYQGSTIFDTGCVGDDGRVSLSYSGSSTRVTVDVRPNCAGGGGTLWEFTVHCP